MTIRSWPISERPRERLLTKGAQTLSDAELLAVLLRNGIKGKDAVSLARELLIKFGGLRGLLSAESKALKKELGLGPAKAATFIAIRDGTFLGSRAKVLDATGIKCALDRHATAVCPFSVSGYKLKSILLLYTV